MDKMPNNSYKTRDKIHTRTKCPTTVTKLETRQKDTHIHGLKHTHTHTKTAVAKLEKIPLS